MKTVYLGLGSNVGDRIGYLEGALRKLNEDLKISVSGISSIYETEPVGFKEQGDFLNMVCAVETTYELDELFERCMSFELDASRKRSFKNAPRTLDIDILFADPHSGASNITVPHLRMHERAFVMVPFLEIAPHLKDVFPDDWKRDRAAVRKYQAASSLSVG